MVSKKCLSCVLLVTCFSCVGSIKIIDEDNIDLSSDDVSTASGKQSEGLLSLLRDLPDEQIIAGQESTFWDAPWENWFPTTRDSYVQDKSGGKYPGLFSSDFGDFALRDLDYSEERIHELRGRLVDVIAEYADQGSLIMLSYHMCPPDEVDGCGYNVMAGYSDGNPYPEWRIDEILTEGTELNQTHIKRLDDMAGHLKTLKNKGINVIWRPFHEMNGPWFWWGKQHRYVELYRQMHTRFSEVHQLDNLIWAWSVNYWNTEQEENPARYYPGHDVVDLIGADIYISHGHSYDVSMYDELLDIGEHNKPMAITENGALPDWPQMAREQPKWAFWATWFGFENRTSDQDYNRIFNDDRVMTLDDLPPGL